MGRRIAKRGSVVMVRYPFTALSGTRVRSAIIITPGEFLKRRVHTRFLTDPVFARESLVFRFILTANELGERRFRHF